MGSIKNPIISQNPQRMKPDEQPHGAIRALHPENGNLKWEFRTQNPLNAGVLTTRGNLLFSGTGQGEFFALNATTGELSWRFRTNGGLNAAPMIYAVDGRQYVAAPIGQALFVFGIDGELGCVNSKSALWLQTQKRAAFQHW